MPVIAFLGNKGGAGKTTLSVNLAAGLAKQTSAIVVDADPQGSAIQWNALTDSDASISVLEARVDLNIQLNELSQVYDYIVVDCPPSVHTSQPIRALEVSDLALIPVQPSPWIYGQQCTLKRLFNMLVKPIQTYELY